MVMHPDNAARFIETEVRIERPDVVAAKGFVLKEKTGETLGLGKVWAQQAVGDLPSVLPLYEEDPSALLRRYAKFFSAELAVYQAVWELVAAGLLFPAGAAATKMF